MRGRGLSVPDVLGPVGQWPGHTPAQGLLLGLLGGQGPWQHRCCLSWPELPAGSFAGALSCPCTGLGGNTGPSC